MRRFTALLGALAILVCLPFAGHGQVGLPLGGALHKVGTGDPNSGGETCPNVGKDRYIDDATDEEWYCSDTDTWTKTAGSGGGGATSEAELESDLSDVSDVFTNNDGTLADDDLSDDPLTALSDVTAKLGDSTTVQMASGSAADGQVCRADANGNATYGVPTLDAQGRRIYTQAELEAGATEARVGDRWELYDMASGLDLEVGPHFSDSDSFGLDYPLWGISYNHGGGNNQRKDDNWFSFRGLQFESAFCNPAGGAGCQSELHTTMEPAHFEAAMGAVTAGPFTAGELVDVSGHSGGNTIVFEVVGVCHAAASAPAYSLNRFCRDPSLDQDGILSNNCSGTTPACLAIGDGTTSGWTSGNMLLRLNTEESVLDRNCKGSADPEAFCSAEYTGTGDDPLDLAGATLTGRTSGASADITSIAATSASDNLRGFQIDHKQDPGSVDLSFIADLYRKGVPVRWDEQATAFSPGWWYPIQFEANDGDATTRTSIWFDESNNVIRGKINGKPTSETDGGEVMLHTSDANHGLTAWGISDAAGAAAFDTGTEVCVGVGLACQDVIEFSVIGIPTDSDCATAHANAVKFLAFCQ